MASFHKRCRYRAAQARDFKFSGRVSDILAKEIGPDWHNRISRPYISEDIDRLGGDYDFAIIVVDPTRNTADRFSLVIFSESADHQKPHTPFWLYRDRDLSGGVLRWSRAGLYLTNYDEDGAETTCLIMWDTNKQTYVCS